MTVTEMSRRFDIFYNNISSNQAPGLNTYEKSVILTKAQDELVKERYSPFNKIKKGFESSENRRIELKQLITPYSTSDNYTKTDIAIDDNSLFFQIPDNIYYILQEEVTLSDDSDDCISGTKVKVIPIKYDEYSTSKINPFRKPNKRKVWRMDIESATPQDTNSDNDIDLITNTVPMVEIISVYGISEYKMRYIRTPQPIVLETFSNNSDYDGLDLTVEGIDVATECELSDELQSNIVDRAVELAILGYKENTLQANVELNKRNV
tara:strand:+ start:4723 stop:5517 length:795 start_codon:yes stop_codon:yes gene_type:complete